MYTKSADQILLLQGDDDLQLLLDPTTTTNQANSRTEHQTCSKDHYSLWSNGQPFSSFLQDNSSSSNTSSCTLGDSFSSLDSETSMVSSSSSSVSSTTTTTTTTNRKSKQRLPGSFRPTNYSVVFGRGAECFNATGNRRFRATAQLFLMEYAEAQTKLEKSAIVSKLVDLVRESSPEGAFVRYEGGCWWEVSDAVAREKVGAQLRDLLHTKYRSSTKAKLEKRKQKVAAAAAAAEAASISSSQDILLPSTTPSSSTTAPITTVVQQLENHHGTMGVDDNRPLSLNEDIDPSILLLSQFSSLLDTFCEEG